jgi:hypothetical protein
MHYAVNDTLTASGGVFTTPTQIKVLTLDVNNGVETYEALNSGACSYSTLPVTDPSDAAGFTGSAAGTGFTCTLGWGHMTFQDGTVLWSNRFPNTTVGPAFTRTGMAVKALQIESQTDCTFDVQADNVGYGVFSQPRGSSDQSSRRLTFDNCRFGNVGVCGFYFPNALNNGAYTHDQFVFNGCEAYVTGPASTWNAGITINGKLGALSNWEIHGGIFQSANGWGLLYQPTGTGASTLGCRLSGDAQFRGALGGLSAAPNSGGAAAITASSATFESMATTNALVVASGATLTADGACPVRNTGTTIAGYSGAGVVSGRFVRGFSGTNPSWAGAVGEVILCTAPASLGIAEWVCTTAGTAGAGGAVWSPVGLAGLGYARESVANSLTAAGTNQGTGLQLASQINNIATAATGTGVVLPAVSTAGIGASVVLFNGGAHAIKVYGAGSDTIDGVAGSTGVTLTNAKRCAYISVAAGTWISAQLGVASA